MKQVTLAECSVRQRFITDAVMGMGKMVLSLLNGAEPYLWMLKVNFSFERDEGKVLDVLNLLALSHLAAK